MKHEIIYLKDIDERFSNSEAYIEYYGISYMDYMKHTGERYPRPGILILPGGAYVFLSDREAEPIALRFMCEGFNTFVLKYSTNKKYPIPQSEVALAISYIREHHEQFDLIDKNLFVMGFSAGGHLAASYSCYYKEIGESLSLDVDKIRPLGAILGYPVITCKDYSHTETKNVITQGDEQLQKKLSIEDYVTSEYPPTYIFTTKEDICVDPQNTYSFVDSLIKAGVKHKSHIFDLGEHGGSLYTRGVYAPDIPQYIIDAIPNRVWVEEASDFMFEILKEDEK